MRLTHMAFGAALALVAAAASGEPWQHEGDRIAVPAAGLSFPLRAATLSLTETSEASRAGDGVDNVAQYKSADKAVFGTLFVYMPAYADAALAAYELDKVIREHFGPDARLASSGVVPAAGVTAAAIRRVYVNASDGRLASTAAVLKAGRWIAVLRVSGPMERRAEVEAALDALVAGLQASAAPIDPVAELQVSECPAPARKDAKRERLRLEGAGLSDDPMTRALIDAALSSAAVEKGKDEPPLPTSIAQNGHRPVCVRARVAVGDNVIDLMQPAGDTEKPEAIIGLVNDAGKTIEMERQGNGKLYALRLHDVARTDNFGTFRGPLSAAQIDGLFSANGRGFQASSRTDYKADGTFGTTMFIATGN